MPPISIYIRRKYVINAVDIRGEDIYIITDNKAVKVAIETLRKTDIGRKLLEKYEKSPTNDVYISAQNFMNKDVDGYTIGDAGKSKAIDENGKINLKGSKVSQQEAIDFTKLDGIDVSKSKGKTISLITLNISSYEKNKTKEDKAYNAEAFFHELAAHVDKYDRVSQNADKEHEAIGVKYTRDKDGNWKAEVLSGSDMEKLRQQLEKVLVEENKKRKKT